MVTSVIKSVRQAGRYFQLTNLFGPEDRRDWIAGRLAFESDGTALSGRYLTTRRHGSNARWHCQLNE